MTKTVGALGEKFELKATMFRDGKSLKYEPKLLFFFVDVSSPDQSSLSKPNECSIDLSSLQLDDGSGVCTRLALRGGGTLDGACLSLKVWPKMCCLCVHFG